MAQGFQSAICDAQGDWVILQQNFFQSAWFNQILLSETTGHQLYNFITNRPFD